MSYAGEKLILDADSHLMELPDFLSRHADENVRDLMPSFSNETLAVPGVRFGGDAPEHSAHDPIWQLLSEQGIPFLFREYE